MNTSNKFVIVCIVAFILAVGSVVGLRIFPKNTTSLLSPNTPTAPETCDCYILLSSESGSYLVDSVSGKKYPRIAPKTNPIFSQFNNRYRSFSANAEVVVENNFRQSYLIEFPAGVPRLIYTTDVGKVIRTAVWSADDQSVIFGVGSITQNLEPSDVLPTELVLVDLDAGTSTTVLSVESLSGRSIKEVFPFAATREASTIIFSSGIPTAGSFYKWNRENNTLTPLPNDIVSNIYFAYAPPGDPNSEGDPAYQGNLFWYDSRGLHIYRIHDGFQRTVRLSIWSDSPFSKPSPSGAWIVYLQKSDSGSGGLLTLLNLITGEGKILSSKPVTGNFGLAYSWWSPDETRLVFAENIGPQPQYSFIRTDPAAEKVIKQIPDDIVPENFQIEALVPR